MEEARRLGDRYAPDDMEQARKDKLKTVITKIKPTIEKILEIYVDEISDGNSNRFRNTMVQLMRSLPNAPRLSRRTDKDSKLSNKAMIEDYFAELEEMYRE